MASICLPDVAIYVHIPWCERKCPYCDFNSHEVRGQFPEQAYIDCLIEDLTRDLPLLQGRRPGSIYFGGGTPSLLSAKGLKRLMDALASLCGGLPAEVTLEVNPGTVDVEKLKAFADCAINRLSIGVQSFDDQALRGLGRIHNGQQARRAIDAAMSSGYSSINLDLMYGLPGSKISNVLADIKAAQVYGVPHVSWYQLTIEPNTTFYSAPPPLPDDDLLWDMFKAGAELLGDTHEQYEVSAWCLSGEACRHNMNYWQFGDYLGIGAGAHGKITLPGENRVVRTRKTRLPAHYMRGPAQRMESDVCPAELPLEFLMNALRLTCGVPESYFEARTGQALTVISEFLSRYRRLGLLQESPVLATTKRGYLMLDSLLGAATDLVEGRPGSG